ncbi:MAG: hypothetical protein AB9856_00050 [Cellulosilyticaceae bacterium]
MIDIISNLLAVGDDKKINSNDEIKRANNYLVGDNVEKPNWIDEFLKRNSNTLMEIVCRSTGPKEFLQVKHYSEGYFNEIIQNANDLHVGNQIDIDIKKKDKAIIVKCIYGDKGFKVQDIYGFCKNGMSAKGEGHTGKFGIGIKSLFSFVDTFKIISNVIIEFTNMYNREKLHQTCCINENWDKKNTVLEFSFNVDKETSFNIKKLVKVAEILEEDYEKFSVDGIKLFTSNASEELLFDVHSLLFTDAQNKMHITKIKFNDKLLLQSETIKEQEKGKNTLNIKQKKISLVHNGINVYEQIIDLFYQDNIILGFDKMYNENRLYSVYYLKGLESTEIKDLGLYIHTPYTNSSRSDLGENKKEIDARVGEIKNKLADLMLNIAKSEESEGIFGKEISEYFHKCLNAYKLVSVLEDENYNLNNIFYKCCKEKVSNKKLLKSPIQIGYKPYIVNENEQEAYNQEYMPFEEYGTGKILTDVYRLIIEQNEVITIKELIESDGTIKCIKELYSNIASSEEWLKQILNYYACVENFIRYRINPMGQVSAELIGQWLEYGSKELGKEKEIYLCKLLGRYKIHSSFTEYGKIKENALTFVDYVFMNQNVTANNSLGEFLIKKYNSTLNELKNVLRKGIVEDFEYYKPYGPSCRGWDGSYDYARYNSSQNNIEKKLLEELIEILSNDSQTCRYFSKINSNLVLCSSILSNFYYRERRFKYDDIEKTSVIGVDFLKSLYANSITQLKLYQKVADSINNKVGPSTVRVSAYLDKITIKELEVLITWLLERKQQYQPIAEIKIGKINSHNGKNLCEKSKRDILEPILGCYVFQGELNISGKNGSHLVVYVKKGQIKYKLTSKSDFETIGTTYGRTNEDEIYIFGSTNLTVDKTLDYVLGDVKDKDGNDLGNDTKEIIDGIVVIKPVGITIQSNQYEKLDFNNRHNDLNNYRNADTKIITYPHFKINLQVQKRILLARGSYNNQCPICKENISKLSDARIFTIPYNGNYIKGVACLKCMETMKVTLTGVHYNEQDSYLDLYCKYHLDEYQSKSRIIKVSISPVNKLLM